MFFWWRYSSNSREKSDKWAATWQNQQSDCAPSEDSDQPGHPPSLIRVFAVRMKKDWVLSYPLSAQRRLWSDWADAQADLSLRWARTHFVGFIMSRLSYLNRFTTTLMKENKLLFYYLDPILIYISLWIDCLFEIRKIAVFPLAFVVGSLQGTDEALLAETT